MEAGHDAASMEKMPETEIREDTAHPVVAERRTEDKEVYL
jgi:hypothetical protein